DVHKKTVAVCERVPGTHGDRSSARADLRHHHGRAAPAPGLTRGPQRHVRDQWRATGVCWWPVSYVLEEPFTCILANAAQIAQVPGRKAGLKGCAWIARPLEQGLIRASFVPPAPILKLRDLMRYRKVLIQERPPRQPPPGGKGQEGGRGRAGTGRSVNESFVAQ